MSDLKSSSLEVRPSVEDDARALLEDIERMDRGTTHWAGCERNHFRCRMARLLRSLLGARPRQETAQSAWVKRATEAESLAATLFQRYVEHALGCAAREHIPRRFDHEYCTCKLRELAAANQSIVALGFLRGYREPRR